jgi:2-methylisocitrate lyase-like PEP mutase family enzyme
MLSQKEKGTIFHDLHRGPTAFIIPNPWDVGTARLLAHLGFQALATTSAGYAFSVGRPDRSVSRDEMLSHVSQLAAACNLPISADLENGFGDSPEMVAVTVRLAAEAGAVGCSIEDMSRSKEHPIYEFSHAVDRVRAAAEAASKLPFRFTLTARAENYLAGRDDLSDTIRRLQAFQEAGADVLYAPGLPTRDAITTVVNSVNRPVNVLVGLQGVRLSLAALSEIGVRRVSVGSLLSRTSLGAFLAAAQEMRDQGTFAFADAAINFGTINGIFGGIDGYHRNPGK